MSDAGAFDPYAPPKSDIDGPSFRARATGRVTPGLRKALKRLNKHVADPDAVARDLKAAGPRLRVVSIVFIAVFMLGVLLSIAGVGDMRSPLLPIGLGVAFLGGLFAILLVVLDLSLVRRDAPATPEATLKSFLKSLSAGRNGYAWATLCPTAREQTVRAPSLGPVATVDGEFSMAHESGIKGYAQAFARPGRGHMRQMSVKRVHRGDIDGDVATVEVEAVFQSWPSWVTIVMTVGFIIFRPLIILGVILFFVMRKRFEARFTKTLLRGENGLWYVYDADLFESGPAG